MARRFKKVEGGHGHHGGAWKVAYADFVTAMMALFMVLWLLASTDSASRKEISQYFRTGILPEGDLSMNHASQVTPAIIEETGTPPAPDADRSLQESKQDAAKSISDKLGKLAALDGELADVIKNVTIKITADGLVIETVDEDKGLLFDLASTKLNEPLEKFIRALTPVLMQLGAPVEIDGHTDARPFPAGSRMTNWQLSYERAEKARQILEASGLPPSRIAGIFARGSSHLYIPSEPLNAKNRRLSFVVKLANAPEHRTSMDKIRGSKSTESQEPPAGTTVAKEPPDVVAPPPPAPAAHH